MEQALSYAHNIPIFIFTVFLISLCMYHLISAYKDRDNVLKHKINTKIREELYY